MPDLYDVLNCPLDYYCAKDWSTLVPTKNPNLKHCTECKKDVMFCATFEEFDDMAERGHCVAYMVFTDEETKGMTRRPVTITMGLPVIRKKK